MKKDLLLFLALSFSINFAKVLAVDNCEKQQDGSRLAHPTDCTKFLVCRQGLIERILNCPLGLHFNRFNSICDIRERAACGAKYVKATVNNSVKAGCSGGDCVDTPTPGSDNNVFASDTNPSNIDNTVGPSTGPSGTTCINAGKCIRQPDGTMFADPNTTGYIVCQCECQIEMPCAPGTKFVESLKTCDHINGSGGNSGHNTKNCVNPGKCAGQRNGVIFPNPTTKTGYIQCQDECELERSCPPGTIFNGALKACVNPSDEGEGDGSCGTSGIKCTNPGKCAGKVDGTILPALNNTSFIVCLCQCEQIKLCAPHTIFQASLNGCVSDHNNCANPGKCAGQRNGVIFPNPTTKTGYIQCQDECELERSCPPGTIFNGTLAVCVITSDEGEGDGSCGTSGIKCLNPGKCAGKMDGTVLPASNNTSFIVCLCQCEQIRLCAPHTIFQESLYGCVNDQKHCANPGKCAGQPNGAIFPNPTTKTGYLQCQDECELERSCPPGTIFNGALKACVNTNDEGEGDGSCGTSGIKCLNPGKCAGKMDGTVLPASNNTSFIVCLCQCEQLRLCAPHTIFQESLYGCVNDQKHCANPGKCAGQPNGVIFPNPTTKTGYLQCQDECELERSCPPGTIFNGALKACVNTNDEGEGDGSCGTSGIKCLNPGKCAGKADGTILPASNNTSFIVCLCQCEQLRLCAPHTIFQASLYGCVNINGDGSGNGNGSGNENGSGNGNGNGNGNGSGNGNGNGSGNGSGSNGSCETSGIKCTSPGKCASQPDGTIFANPNTMAGYIECKCQCELLKPCIPGTIFDEALNICFHAVGGGGSKDDDKGGCTGGQETNNSTSSTAGSDSSGCGGSGGNEGNTSDGASNSDCDSDKVICQNPGKCASQPDGTLFSNPKTTAGYIECKCQCELEKSCVPGTIFNEVLKFCFHPVGGGDLNGEHSTGDTSCSGEGGENGGSCGSSGSEGNNEGTSEGTSDSNCGDGKVTCTSPGKCASQPDGTLFSNPKTTAGYIECKCQCELEKLCVPGTIFKEALKFCVHVVGGGGLNGEHTIGDTNCSSENGESGGSCGSSGSEGNNEGTSEGTSDSNCGDGKVTCTSPGKCASQPDGTLFSNPKTTAGYIECKCQCELEKLCVPGTIFKEALKFCVHVVGGGGLNGQHTTGDEGHVSDGTSDSNCGDAKVTCTSPGKCARQPDGTLFGNPNTPAGYIECKCQCELEKPCVPGTIFNEALKFCIHAVVGGGVNGEHTTGGTSSSTEQGQNGVSCGSGNSGSNEGNTSEGTTDSNCGANKVMCNNPGICANQTDGAIFASSTTTTGYIECKSQCEMLKSCVPGTIFNESLKICFQAVGQGSDGNETSGASDNSAGSISENGCGGTGSYIGDNGNKGYVAACGSVANSVGEASAGIAGSMVGKETGTGGETLSGESGMKGNMFIESGITVGNSNAAIVGPSTGPSGTTCANAGKCAQQPDGTMFRNPNSTGYIVCLCECEIIMACAAGTEFSETLQTCDHIKRM